MKYLNAYLNEFWMLTSEMAPYLLLGFLFAGILHVYFKSSGITKYLGKNNLRSVLNASLFGIPLPLCSCGVIPTGVSLYRNGASKGSSLSFLISTPQTGVDSILVTYSLLGLPFAVIRPIVALITGVVGGFFSSLSEKRNPENIKEQILETDSYPNKNNLYRVLRYGFVDFLQDIVKWLLIGLLIAALLSVVIPDNFFQDKIQNDFLGMLLLLVISIPLYVCATASVPIAAVLILKGLSPGAALVFLMAGPATNIATITVLRSVFGNKTMISYLITITVGAIIAGLFIDNFLPREWFTNYFSGTMNHGHEHHLLPSWLMTSSGIILLLLLVNGLYIRYFKKYISKNTIQKQEINISNNMEKTITVKGMDCNHCKMNVEKNINGLDGVEFVEVDLNTSAVKISGENIDLEKIKSTITGLGYEYVGEKT
jgi:uncharacterized protein